MALNYPDIPTMISREEKDYLYNLIAHNWTGQGTIVEIGPWLGGSTFCLASGLRDSRLDGRKKLHVFDNFIWRDFMSHRSTLTFRDGDSFHDEFKRNLNVFSELLNSYEASLPDEEVLNDRFAHEGRQILSESRRLITNVTEELVEVLFIDGAKSWTGMKHLLAEFSEYFIPNSTLLVCQDYKYWGAYWVVMIIELLAQKLGIEHILVSHTVTFRVTSSISRSEIEMIPSHDLIDIDEGLALLRDAAQRLRDNGDFLGSKVIELCAVRFLVHKDELGKAESRVKELERAWPLGFNDSQLMQTKRWLTEQTGARLPTHWKTYLRRTWKKIKSLTSIRGAVIW